MVKVATIFGLFGGLRREELCKLTVDDIEELEDSLLVRISDTKTNVNRSFCIVGSYVTYCRKYAALRPPNVTHRRFFLKCYNNKCTVQPVGINIFGRMPCEIAELLKLPEPKLFTGHCFRSLITLQ
jgi:integrase